MTPTFEGSQEQSKSEHNESQEEAEVSSDLIEYENTVVTRLETKMLKGVPKEWQETIQVRHLQT